MPTCAFVKGVGRRCKKCGLPQDHENHCEGDSALSRHKSASLAAVSVTTRKHRVQMGSESVKLEGKDMAAGYAIATQVQAANPSAPLSSTAASAATTEPPPRTSSCERKMSVTLQTLTEGVGIAALTSKLAHLSFAPPVGSPRTPRGLRSPLPGSPVSAAARESPDEAMHARHAAERAEHETLKAKAWRLPYAVLLHSHSVSVTCVRSGPWPAEESARLVHYTCPVPPPAGARDTWIRTREIVFLLTTTSWPVTFV